MNCLLMWLLVAALAAVVLRLFFVDRQCWQVIHSIEKAGAADRDVVNAVNRWRIYESGRGYFSTSWTEEEMAFMRGEK